jgi:hypothetical protein
VKWRLRRTAVKNKREGYKREEIHKNPESWLDCVEVKTAAEDPQKRERSEHSKAVSFSLLATSYYRRRHSPMAAGVIKSASAAAGEELNRQSTDTTDSR